MLNKGDNLVPTMTAINVSGFLSQYTSASTKKTYLFALKRYFRLIEPDLKDEGLDEASTRYFLAEPDIRSDIIKFRDALLESPPKTRLLYLNVVVNFMNENGVTVPKHLVKNLNGKEKDALTEEYIPTGEDIARIIGAY